MCINRIVKRDSTLIRIVSFGGGTDSYFLCENKVFVFFRVPFHVGKPPLFGDGAVGGAVAHVADACAVPVGRCGEQFAHACIYCGVVDAVAVVFHIGHAHEGVVFSKSACEGGACDLQAFGRVDVVAVVVATAD